MVLKVVGSLKDSQNQVLNLPQKDRPIGFSDDRPEVFVKGSAMLPPNMAVRLSGHVPVIVHPVGARVRITSIFQQHD